jgi:hypothetical protein
MNEIEKIKISIEEPSGLELSSLIGRVYSVILPKGELQEDIIYTYLKEKGYPVPTNEQVELKWQTLRGTYIKRIAKWLQKVHGVTLNQKEMVELGNIAQRSSGSGDTYVFRIDPPPFNWKDGLFGKRQSCWWSQDHKSIWEDNDGHVVKFYPTKEDLKDKDGIGRIWISQHFFQTLLLFNGYYNHETGNNWTQRLTKVVATALGLSYRSICLEAKNQVIHINGNQGFLVGTLNALEEAINNLPKKNEVHTLLLSPKITKKVYCYSCREKLVSVDDQWGGPNGVIYCKTCFDSTYYLCFLCQRACEIQSKIIISDTALCRVCFDRKYKFCGICMEIVNINNVITINKVSICTTCGKNHTFICRVCSSTAFNIEKTEINLGCALHKDDIRVVCGMCSSIEVNRVPKGYHRL